MMKHSHTSHRAMSISSTSLAHQIATCSHTSTTVAAWLPSYTLLTIHTIFHYHLSLPSYTMFLYHSYNLSLPSFIAFLNHVIPFIQSFITILCCLLIPCYTIHTTFHYHLTLPSCTMFLYHLIPCLLISVVHIRRQSETAPLILVLK